MFFDHSRNSRSSNLEPPVIYKPILFLDPLILRDDITIRATRDRLHCPTPNDPSMGSNLEIQYKAFITGKSTIQPGDLTIDFVFEGSDWMKNPCEGNNIAGLKNRQCKRIDDKLHIEMNNEMSIDAVNYLGKF